MKMNNPISKDEAAWLVIRSAGLVFVWLAFTKIAGFVYVAHILTNEGLRQIRESLSSTMSWEMTWPQASMFLIYGVLAVYFLKYGDKIHRLICTESRISRQDTGPPVAKNSEGEQVVPPNGL